MQRSTLPLVLCLLLTLAGCAPRASGDATSGRVPDLLPPALSLGAGAALVTSFDPPGAGARVLVSAPVTISNPNSFPLHLRSLDFSYTLGDSPEMAHGASVSDTFTLMPGGSREVELQLERSLVGDSELLQAVAASFSGADLEFGISLRSGYSSARHSWLSSRDYRLAGSARAGGGVELPVLTLLSPETSVYDVPSGYPVVKVVLQVENPGAVGYLLHAKDLVLELDGQPVAELDLRPSPVAAFSTGQLALTFTPSAELLPLEARTALSDALAGDPTELAVRGQLALDVLGLGTFDMPAGLQLTTRLHAD